MVSMRIKQIYIWMLSGTWNINDIFKMLTAASIATKVGKGRIRM